MILSYDQAGDLQSFHIVVKKIRVFKELLGLQVGYLLIGWPWLLFGDVGEESNGRE